MTKDFQKELLEKVKPGMKPSDLKKKKPIIPKDEGYSSEEEKSFADSSYLSSQSEVDKDQTADQNLLSQITSLKNQLQLYKDFKEADLKVKEKLKEENTTLKQTITDLQKPGKNPAKETKNQATQTERTFEIKNYSCQICFQERKIPSQFLRAKGFGGERNKKIWVCFLCRKKVVIIYDEEENWRNF